MSDLERATAAINATDEQKAELRRVALSFDVPDGLNPHRLVDVRRAVIEAYEAVVHYFVQGPVVFVRCSCGWTANAEDVNVYAAAEEHGLAL